MSNDFKRDALVEDFSKKITDELINILKDRIELFADDPDPQTLVTNHATLILATVVQLIHLSEWFFRVYSKIAPIEIEEIKKDILEEVHRVFENEETS